ncbi:MAG: helix-turn-helix domain-containing protein, partial [Acidaminococcaceae bacterium]
LDILIKESGFSHKDIESYTSIRGSAISNYRNGKTKPSFEAIIALSKLFKVTSDYLLFGIGDNKNDCLGQSKPTKFNCPTKILDLDYSEIGKRLKKTRVHNNLTQQALADLMGVSVSYIKSTERGSKPSLRYLYTVVSACHVTYDWLLAGIDNNIPPQSSSSIITTVEDLEVNYMNILFNVALKEKKYWAIEQFKYAFKDFINEYEEEKKQHESQPNSSDVG